MTTLGIALSPSFRTGQSAAKLPAMAQVTEEQAVAMALDFHRTGDFPQAEKVYRQILTQNPSRSDVLHLLGVLLFTSGRPEGAADLVRRSLALNPNVPEALNNLGNILQLEGQGDEAIASYAKAMALRPDYVEATNNLGKALQSVGRLDEAMANFRRAIALSPDFAGAHHNLGMLLILRGQYAEGWREHEWRLRKPDFTTPMRNFGQPQWGGSDPNGRTILLHAEQGTGDAIQFARYVPAVQLRDAKVILEVQPELFRLFSGNPSLPGVTVIAKARPQTHQFQFDLNCPLMSLPLALCMFDPAEARGSYLQADPALIELWRKLLPQTNDRKVGIAWAGNPRHQNDRNRSIPFSLLAPLNQPGLQFFSLQVARKETPTDTSLKLIDLTPRITDFADTAALISHLDLVISADTAVAHLAGSMGKPTWLLLPFAPDFRWGITPDSTPWYPSMRLFRQTRIGDWEDVISRVSGEISAKTANPRL
jgi:Tfp pilus assembly protein PilF